MDKRRWIMAATAWGALATGAAAESPAVPSPDTVTALARETMAASGAQGLAIAVIDGGQVASVQTFGLRNARGEPLTPQTIMYGASLTKAVFGYWTAMQADRGRIDLDPPLAARLAKPLPEYGNLDAYGNWGDLAGDERWRSITPRHVLNHATGFANFSFLEPDGKLRFHFDPGSRYGYSGEGIMLLQFAFEADGGASVGEGVAADLFAPLGLTDVGLMWRPEFAANLADGWTESGEVEPHDERSRVRMAGSMDVSPEAMAELAAAMVRGFGLSPAMRAEFARSGMAITTRTQFPSLQPEAPDAERFGIHAGLGAVAFTGPQGAGWFKGGHNDSTANMMVCLEAGQRCVVVMANDVRAERRFPRLIDALLGPTGIPWRWEYPDADY
ncbi:MAG: serine hydrolase domain-containing protein [Erythrobacter sp.]